jgi:hypothetical protein
MTVEVAKEISARGGKCTKKNSHATEPEQSKKPAKNTEISNKPTEKKSNKQLVKDVVVDEEDKKQKRVSFQE